MLTRSAAVVELDHGVPKNSKIGRGSNHSSLLEEMMMRATISVGAAVLLCLAGQGYVRADGPLVRNDGDAGISNLKFTGDVQTDEIRWGRGGYGRWGYGGRWGWGYGYYGGYYGGYPYYAYSSPYYAYSAPYYTYSAP